MTYIKLHALLPFKLNKPSVILHVHIELSCEIKIVNKRRSVKF